MQSALHWLGSACTSPLTSPRNLPHKTPSLRSQPVPVMDSACMEIGGLNVPSREVVPGTGRTILQRQATLRALKHLRRFVRRVPSPGGPLDGWPAGSRAAPSPGGPKHGRPRGRTVLATEQGLRALPWSRMPSGVPPAGAMIGLHPLPIMAPTIC